MVTESPERPKYNPIVAQVIVSKAASNPWYWLATLFGEPDRDDDALQRKNRVAWNRYIASHLREDERISLIEKGRHPADDLMPFSVAELKAIEDAFIARSHGAPTSEYVSWNITFENMKSGMVSFGGSEFDRDFWAAGYLFPSRADFAAARFNRWAIFTGATFFDDAYFGHATFSGWARFAGAAFSRQASFHDATFTHEADFPNATFHSVDFSNTTFHSTISFVNSEMKDITSFNNATFKDSPPQFFGAKLHEGTTWNRVVWPPAPKEASAAFLHVAAYERLKLEMDRLRKHEDELDFFALEMQARRTLLGEWLPVSEFPMVGRMIPGLRIRRPAAGALIAIYGVACDFGRSYVRPFCGLLATILIGALLLWPHFGVSRFEKAIGLSLANTFGVLGLRKDFVSADTLAGLPNLLTAVSGVQTFAGAILLFLLGLALRNRFRMR
jgi:hypothetical protein